MKIQLRVIGSLLVTSVLVGCGGGGVSSGVDRSKPAETVTDAEAQDVCEATIEYQANSVSVDDACKFYGALAGAAAGNDAATCDAAVTACQDAADAAGDQPVNTSVCSNVTAAAVAGCTVTVGEIEDCLTEIIDASADVIKSAPACDSLASASEGGNSGGGDSSSSACDAVAADPECASVLVLAGL